MLNEMLNDILGICTYDIHNIILYVVRNRHNNYYIVYTYVSLYTRVLRGRNYVCICVR